MSPPAQPTMTPREQALLGYFYAVAHDRRVQAAGFSASRLREALLSCVAEDFAAVAAYALRGGVEMVEAPVAQATRRVAETVLGGTVSEKARGEIASGVETLVRDGFRGAAGALNRFLTKK